MKIIGITGGIGAGKTQVLEYLNSRYGATVCQADEVAKKLQKKGFIHVSGISQNKKTLMREYLPSITKAEYVASLLDKDTFLQVASTFVQNNGNDDEEFISALRQLIDQEIKE